ncbi:LytR/AlgR family response regulator transcription factor [Dellaglioa sp. L3N]
MINVAICDDLPKMTATVEKTLMNFDTTLFDISVFFNPQKLLTDITEHHYDLFILDIEFPNYSGIDIAKKIRENDLNVPIIFLTSFNEYMEEVFKVQTFDYIIKPISNENFFPVLQKVIQYLDIDTKSFSFTYNRVSYNLKFNDIIYFEKQKRMVIIHDRHKVYKMNMPTLKLLSALNNNFVQTQASYIVNIRFIKEIGSTYVILSYNSKTIEIPISRKFKHNAHDAILMKLRSTL